jgi:hypothetical protein
MVKAFYQDDRTRGSLQRGIRYFISVADYLTALAIISNAVITIFLRCSLKKNGNFRVRIKMPHRHVDFPGCYRPGLIEVVVLLHVVVTSAIKRKRSLYALVSFWLVMA